MTTRSKISATAIRFLAASTIALGLVPFAAQAHDRPDCGQPQRRSADRIPAHFKALNLSSDQQEKLRAIEATHHELLRKNMATLNDNQAAERALVEAPQFDEQKAEKLAAQSAKIMQDNQLATLRFRHEIYQILTPEQRTKFDATRREHHDKKHS